MRKFTVNINQPTGALPLGRQGENLATQLIFPITGWTEKFGAGTFSLLHQRAQDSSPYPVAITTDGENVYWSVTSSDTQYAGSGMAELVYTVDEVVAKSIIFSTLTCRSLGEQTDPPEPWESWVDEVLAAASGVDTSAQAAASSAAQAQLSEQNASAAAQSAATSESNAATAAGNAASSEESVAGMIAGLTDTPVLTSADITSSGDTVTLGNDKINIKTGATSRTTSVVPLANGTNAGMMSPSDVATLIELVQKVAALQGQTVRLLYTASTSPTAAQIAAFVTAAGYTENLQNIAVIVETTFHVWHYYTNTQAWQDDGVDTVSQFTNSTPGIITGAQTAGKVYAESDGTGSVFGWDALVSSVSNLAAALAALPTLLTLTEAEYEALAVKDEGTYYFIEEET